MDLEQAEAELASRMEFAKRVVVGHVGAPAYSKFAEEYGGRGQEIAKSDRLDEVAELDRLAKERAEKTGETFAKAYDKVLQSPAGSALYSRHVANAENIGLMIENIGGTEVTALDIMARDYSKATGVDYHRAYDAALQTAAGRRLYAEAVAIHNAASRNAAQKTPAPRKDEYSKAQQRADAVDELDRLAKSHSERTGEAYHVAYDKVLRTPQGGQLYALTV
jgi:hypothetical protein